MDYFKLFNSLASSIPFLRDNKVTIESVEDERVVLRMEIQPAARNPYGVVQGGVLYTLADYVAGMVSGLDGRAYVTQNGSMNYLKNQAEGYIYASAVVRHRGQRTCVIAIDILGDKGQLLATGEFTFYCVGENLPESVR